MAPTVPSRSESCVTPDFLPLSEKPVRALAMMQVMSGSWLNRDLDGKNMMGAVIRDIDDGR